MAKMLKRCDRVDENFNEITRGDLCKVVKFTKMANLAKIGHGLGEYSIYMTNGLLGECRRF